MMASAPTFWAFSLSGSRSVHVVRVDVTSERVAKIREFNPSANYQPAVVIATHVPPYQGAAWHEGTTSSPNYQPFFSSPTMGKAITAAAAEHPGKNVLVLCGHTHSPGIYRDGNVLVLTGGARYGFPEISKTIRLDHVGSIFE